jgi:hypothetical protein
MSYELKNLKEDYKKVGEKYNLPSFEELNRDFDVEKIDRESEVLLKHIRKVMMEKIVNSLSFLEMLLNPMNIPRMYMAYVNSMSESDRKVIGEIYSRFSELIVLSLEREVSYDEKDEAEIIKKILDSWRSSEKDIRKILQGVRKPVEKSKREKDYFG